MIRDYRREHAWLADDYPTVPPGPRVSQPPSTTTSKQICFPKTRSTNGGDIAYNSKCVQDWILTGLLSSFNNKGVSSALSFRLLSHTSTTSTSNWFHNDATYINEGENISPCVTSSSKVMMNRWPSRGLLLLRLYEVYECIFPELSISITTPKWTRYVLWAINQQKKRLNCVTRVDTNARLTNVHTLNTLYNLHILDFKTFHSKLFWSCSDGSHAPCQFSVN